MKRFSKFHSKEPKWVRLRFSPWRLLLKSEAKLVEVSVTLLMGSQSFCSDPYPPSILFQDKQSMTALDSSSGAAARCPGSLRVWPSVDSSLRALNLSFLLLSLVWRQGHQVITGLGMRARPPVGGLLVILHCLQEETASRLYGLETVLWQTAVCRWKTTLPTVQTDSQTDSFP